MDTNTLAILVVVVMTFVVFGPKPSLKKEKSKPAKSIKVKHVERVSSLTPLYVTGTTASVPHGYAAGRAPSPLQRRQAPSDNQQFALASSDGKAGGAQGAPLPHELPGW
ncbi:MAG: hypothetical protein ACPGYP_07805 [Solirubrobacterales bacterium]